MSVCQAICRLREFEKQENRARQFVVAVSANIEDNIVGKDGFDLQRCKPLREKDIMECMERYASGNIPLVHVLGNSKVWKIDTKHAVTVCVDERLGALVKVLTCYVVDDDVDVIHGVCQSVAKKHLYEEHNPHSCDRVNTRCWFMYMYDDNIYHV